MIDYTIQIKEGFDSYNLRAAVAAIIEVAKRRTNFRENRDMINIIATNPELPHPIPTGLKETANPQNILDIIDKHLTFNQTFNLQETVFTIQIIAMPQGSKGSKIIKLAEDVCTKKSITRINNDDNLCRNCSHLSYGHNIRRYSRQTENT